LVDFHYDKLFLQRKITLVENVWVMFSLVRVIFSFQANFALAILGASSGMVSDGPVWFTFARSTMHALRVASR